MRLTAAEGGLQTPRRKPGSFLLFVGFYVRLLLEHRRTDMKSFSAAIRSRFRGSVFVVEDIREFVVENIRDAVEFLVVFDGL